MLSAQSMTELAGAALLFALPTFAAQSTITAAPAVPTAFNEDLIGYSQTTTYETTSPLPLTE
jgi:hypothetical protein